MFVDTEKRTQGEPQKVGALKLSEAMRIGARLRPQGFNVVFAREDKKTSCALQAAVEGKTGMLIASTHACRKLLGIDHSLSFDIWMKNDVDKWTREQIADWLEERGY